MPPLQQQEDNSDPPHCSGTVKYNIISHKKVHYIDTGQVKVANQKDITQLGVLRGKSSVE